jgi:DNA-directed RNA polymerase specialized sigma24 family protein
MDPRNFHEGKVEVLRLGKIFDDKERCRLLGLADFMAANPVRKIISAIDLEAWLAELSAEDRQLLSMRMVGCGWNEIGNELGISGSSAWARCRRLGHELAERAQLEIPVSRRQERN